MERPNRSRTTPGTHQEISGSALRHEGERSPRQTTPVQWRCLTGPGSDQTPCPCARSSRSSGQPRVTGTGPRRATPAQDQSVVVSGQMSDHLGPRDQKIASHLQPTDLLIERINIHAGFGLGVLALEKTRAASSSCFFPALICLGCTS